MEETGSHRETEQRRNPEYFFVAPFVSVAPFLRLESVTSVCPVTVISVISVVSVSDATQRRPRARFTIASRSPRTHAVSISPSDRPAIRPRILNAGIA